MSKFWGGAESSDSEDEVSEKEVLSGSEAEDGSSDEGEEGEGEREKDIDWGIDTDSEGEESKRVVKSVRDKRYEEMHKLIESLEKDMKEADWVNINTDFQSLSVWIKKASNLINKEGVPGPYISILIQLEDYLKQTNADKEAKKAMSKNNSKAFNTFAQKLKKHNKDYQAEIDGFRKNPTAFNKAVVKKEKKAEASDDEEEEDDLDDIKALAKPKKAVALSDEEEEDEEWQTAAKAGRKGAKKPQQAAAPVQAKIVWTDELVAEKLDEVVKKRGMKKATPKELIEQLKELLANVKAAQKKVEIYMQIIAIMFDRTSANITKAMKPGAWNRARGYIAELLQLLSSDNSLVLNESASVAATETEDGSLPAVTHIAVNLTSFIEQLDTEFTKGLHHVDPHTHEYVDRLRQESLFLELAGQVQEYYEKHGDKAQAARIAMKRVEHIYYKHDTISEKLEEAHIERQKEAQKKKEGQTEVVPEADDKKASGSVVDMEKLCVLIYTHGDERLKTNALLCHVYHHALHDRFHQARDLMLMSHIQDNIQHMDARMQVLFNRSMVQLGLCAFRKGYIYEAHSCLSDICSGKTREYLAQGMSSARFQEKNPEQEKLEKLRQVPFHMHINLDLLDTVHLTTAMLLEIPNMAAHPHDIRPKVISRALRRSLDSYEKNYFTGPPESTRDYCVVAARALAKGDWKRTEELLLGLPAWALVQNSESVKVMLKRKIQEEGLRTYIFTFSPYYTAMSLEELSNIFELPQTSVHSLISKMIINKEIQASWDQPTGTLVMHKAQSSRLQLLALQLADKAGVLVENNERLLESAKPGGYGYKFDNKGGKGGYDSRRQGGPRRGGYGGYQGGGYQGGQGQRRGGGWAGGQGRDRRQGGGYQGGGREDRSEGGGYQGQRNVADGFVRQERRQRRGGRQQDNAWNAA